MRLGSDQLEQLLVMELAWQGSIVDWTAVYGVGRGG